MKQPLPPMVNLDSDAIRRIREEKRLTQLYVAKVVGVTTDTVSRWENNRYPSIKRENALRLAEALEIPVGDILEKGTAPTAPDQGADVVPEEPAGEKGSPLLRRIVALVFFAFVAVAVTVFFWGRQDELALDRFSAQRLLPNYAAPETVIPVRIRLMADTTAKGFILREHFPRGWKMVEASPPPSSLDNEAGVARWIIKPGEERPRVVYRLKVDATADVGSQARFSGEIVVSPTGRSLSVPTNGDKVLKVAPIIWADLDGDGVIDDGEMLEASDTYDEMRGVHMDWDILEKIWDAGGYRWDAEEVRFIPERPAAPNASSPLTP
ncbi:Transcriptional regulator, contains XRE-family HTH domain [Geoalkalibacter ferrihydriticus]|uniref:Transcriptional regulator, contains XRE-family HTH domain n=1 Tax=Geoalkalibacter ferrihydriticus TaxID=392333 RepID=A0A1G9JQ69_9BACT|nr:helix-turn-helix transcriptional regulator [Geoalkalibacter ferrihydriticus]SDL39700.1 Transcriptional regulator, contains XRE-family HTH domain [Geoalkalibacter ferrihydriticus]